MNKVMIINGNQEYRKMFLDHGWETTDDIHKADLIQFTGGEDVWPDLYGVAIHPYTSCNAARDLKEKRIFSLALSLNVPMAGICRGGQFLNVMCGGELWQHVDNHAIYGTHHIYDIPTGRKIQTTSTHHQMMKPSIDGVIVATAGNLSTYKETMEDNNVVTVEMSEEPSEDVEVVYYPGHKVLCHQGHPEYLDEYHPSQVYYFELLEDYLQLSSAKM